MIRKITANEKSINTNSDYVFERNGYKTWLDEKHFRQLAFESISLLDDLLKEKWENHFEKMKGID